MIDLFAKIQRDGLLTFARKKITAPFRTGRKQLYRDILAHKDAGTKFELIYKNRLWGSGEALSGAGSSIKFTANLRKELSRIVADYNIHSIVDAPCGNFIWMRAFLEKHPTLHYTGVDIVQSVIKENHSGFGAENRVFEIMDITNNKIPEGDLLIVRDCLFHLSYDDIDKFLENFHRGQHKYLLTTTHIEPRDLQNRDIVTGDFRPIDIFSPPIAFDPATALERIDDWIPPTQPRQMILFARDDVPRRLNRPTASA